MTNQTIADTGVIVAFLNKREQYHAWAQERMRRLPVPYLTCEPVITEACFLMQPEPNGEQDVLNLIRRGVLQVDFLLSETVTEVQSLMKKYENVPMSLADACLVRMSELHNNSTVFTLDRDFWIYRKNGNEQIPLIIPDKSNG